MSKAVRERHADPRERFFWHEDELVAVEEVQKSVPGSSDSCLTPWDGSVEPAMKDERPPAPPSPKKAKIRPQKLPLPSDSSYMRRTISTRIVKEKEIKEFEWTLRGRKVTAEKTLERLKKVGVPPSWENVRVAAEATSRLQAVGIDKAGRVQRRYSAQHAAAQANKKFTRVKQFSADIDDIRAAVLKDASNDLVEARLLQIEDKTAMRIGGGKQTGKVKSHGLTTLEREHVVVQGNKVTFDYVAKEGIRQVKEITVSRETAMWLQRRIAATPPKGLLFPDVTPSQLNRYLQRVSGKSYTVKDFRTLHATRIANAEVQSFAGQTLTKKQVREIIKEASEKASRFLGNTPSMAKASYIDPAVFDQLDSQIGKVIVKKPKKLFSIKPTDTDDLFVFDSGRSQAKVELLMDKEMHVRSRWMTDVKETARLVDEAVEFAGKKEAESIFLEVQGLTDEAVGRLRMYGFKKEGPYHWRLENVKEGIVRGERLSKVDMSFMKGKTTHAKISSLDDLKVANSRKLSQAADDAVGFNEDGVLKAAYKEQGYDGKPQLITQEQLEAAEVRGGRVLYRGVNSTADRTAEEFISAMKEGEYFAGRGITGNGTYSAYGENGLFTARQYADGDEAVMRMILKSDARVITYREAEALRLTELKAIQREMQALSDVIGAVSSEAEFKAAQKVVNAARAKLGAREAYAQDVGRVAAGFGYDAIHIVSDEYMVILNRTALRIVK